MPSWAVNTAWLHHVHVVASPWSYPAGVLHHQKPEYVEPVSWMDTMDAISGPRSYNIGRTWKDAIPEIKRCVGRQFDPRFLPAFEDMEKMELFRLFYDTNSTQEELVERIHNHYSPSNIILFPAIPRIPTDDDMINKGDV